MAMEAAARIAPKPRAPFAPSHPWDRNFFLAYVALLWCGILGGFVPEMVQHIAQRKPPFPLIIHVHGIVFLGWLVLLTAQVVLIRRQQHQPPQEYDTVDMDDEREWRLALRDM